MASRRHQRSRQVRLRRTIAAAATLVVVVIAVVFCGHLLWPPSWRCRQLPGGRPEHRRDLPHGARPAFERVDDRRRGDAPRAPAAGGHRRAGDRHAGVEAHQPRLRRPRLDRTFQQRPSQGWGSKEQLIDPIYATGKFYDALVKVASWQSLPIAAAAQAVQRSGFPDAYASWQPRATALAAALTGTSELRLTCRLAHPGVARAAHGSASANTPASTGSASAAVPSAESFSAGTSAGATAGSVAATVSSLTSALAADLDVHRRPWSVTARSRQSSRSPG